jgi:hypothetical protein
LASLTPRCRGAYRWQTVHADLDLIARIESSKLGLREALRLAVDQAAEINYLLPEYLFARGEHWRRGDEDPIHFHASINRYHDCHVRKRPIKQFRSPQTSNMCLSVALA